MEYVEFECKLLYKQSLETWLEERDRTRKFSDEELESLTLFQQKYPFLYDDSRDNPYNDKFYLDGRLGHLYFTEPELVLFSFTEMDGTKTLYHLSLEEQNVDNKSCQNGAEGSERDQESERSGSLTSTKGYQKVYVENLIKGSNYGRKILAYATEGHIFLIDLDTKTGQLVAKWPVDPRLTSGGGCCQLIPYDPDVKAAVNGDFSLVAVTGPSEEDEEPSIRIINVDTKECKLKSLKFMKANPGLLDSAIHMISFNPYHTDLLYISLYVSKSRYLGIKLSDSEQSDSDDEVDDDDNDSDDDVDDDDNNDSDDDNDDNLALVLFDLSTEQVVAEILGVSLISFNGFYNTVGAPKFLKQGSMLLTYKVNPQSNTMVIFLDAFSLEIVGSGSVTGIDTVLGNHVLTSLCESELAIFKYQNNLSSSDKLKYDVEVYKIPDFDFSLKNFCRKVIISNVNRNNIDRLSLPDRLKYYLKL